MLEHIQRLATVVVAVVDIDFADRFDGANEEIINDRKRNGRQGTWRVPGRRRSYRSHSGAHYVFNKWGDTRMGIGFGREVSLTGVWLVGHMDPTAWSAGPCATTATW